ncbi:MAG: transglycosylase domain-containing protein, partial [Candidatus Taylorbacteria bacterium]
MKHRHSRHAKHVHHIRSLILLGGSLLLIILGCTALWIATLKMPDLNSFENRKISDSTKIYDRTGTILLYDTGANAKRSTLALTDISPFIQRATIAIEDSNFYNNIGIEPTSIVRALIANIATGGYGQGASTITQQVVKNSLLTQDKTISRKIKEWVLSIKLTKIMTKDKILETYLNDTSYGGTIFGVEEASQQFFGRPAKDVTLGQAAYLAAIPQAPTYFSPYGTHRDALTTRHNVVLQRMHDLGMITDADYKSALAEKVEFLSKNSGSIRAPHFVMFVRDYLTQKYGDDVVNNGGLRVITSLDYDMQQKAEDAVNKFAPSMATNFNASNTAMVAIDPKTGDILTMIGSKDYFDPSIDGNFNIALAERQPGSTIKPFVYSTAFKKGYTPETVLFDVPMEFSTQCTVDGKPKDPTANASTTCYAPNDYDQKFEGPLTIKKALSESRNLPAIQALYLAGIKDSIQTAHDMGITSLNDPDRYGLTLVLGGGEVNLLDMTSAYGVFANDGIRNPYRSVLKVTDSKGNVLEQSTTNPSQVLQPEIARQISDILSDPAVRMDSLKQIAESVGRQVAIKTGTTNDYRDVWIMGYTPSLVVGAWAGKNDNSPMSHNVAGLIISPLWGAFVSQVAKNFPPENFQSPPPPLTDDPAVLRGIWQGGTAYKVDSISGKLATQYTPVETQKDIVIPNVHSILYWVDRNNPRGPAPSDASTDSQYPYWEYGVR